jgi:AcrR family transcriptional regulator
VRDIIRATPLASGTFYNYFKSKEEVYQALRDELALAIRPPLRAARQAATTAEEFFATGFRLFLEFAAAQRGDTPPAVETSRFRMDSPEVLAGLAELKADIEAAIARGVLPAVDAGFLVAAVAGLAFELAEQVKAGAEPEAAARFATTLLLGGISATAVAPP